MYKNIVEMLDIDICVKSKGDIKILNFLFNNSFCALTQVDIQQNIFIKRIVTY